MLVLQVTEAVWFFGTCGMSPARSDPLIIEPRAASITNNKLSLPNFQSLSLSLSGQSVLVTYARYMDNLLVDTRVFPVSV